MIRKRQPARDDRHIRMIVYRELIPQTRKSFPEFRVNKSMIQKRLKQGVTFVAAHRGRSPIGFVTVVKKGNVLLVDMLAVRRSFHGKGWGSILLEHAERYGIKEGCTTIMLCVDQYNDNAQLFYARKGYKQLRYVDETRCYLLAKMLGDAGITGIRLYSPAQKLYR
jgi:ribosomal protein S18 acetylase RimI-like enzyme